MCILGNGMRFKAGLRALTWSTVDPRRTSETIKLLEISRWASYSELRRNRDQRDCEQKQYIDAVFSPSVTSVEDRPGRG